MEVGLGLGARGLSEPLCSLLLLVVPTLGVVEGGQASATTLAMPGRPATDSAGD